MRPQGGADTSQILHELNKIGTVISLAKGDKGDTGATGPAGPAGTAGADGADGADGKTVLNGTGAPGAGVGTNGDFYIDTAADMIYGPKASGTWPAGVSLIGPKGDQGDKGDKGDQGDPGVDAVAGQLPSNYVEVTTPVGTSSATLEDVTGGSLTVTLEETVHIAVMASFQASTQSGTGSSTIAVAFNINGTDHDETQRYLSGTTDTGIGAIIHRTATALAAGTYTIKLRFRRVSYTGTAVPGLDRADILVVALQGAKGSPGDSEYIAKTNTDYTITDTDGYQTIGFSTGNTNRACNLPTAADNVGRSLRIIKTDSGTGYVTISAEGSEKINGVSSIVVELQYRGLELKCDGSNWFIVGTIGECEIQTIGSAIELVYTWVKETTFDGSPADSHAHGIPDTDKIIDFSIASKTTGGVRYLHSLFTTSGEWIYASVDATNVNVQYNATYYNGTRLCIKIKYYI